MTAINDKELTAAQEAAKTAPKLYVRNLEIPLDYNEKTYTSLTFDWSRLTGRDSLAIEAEMAAMGKAVITPEFSGEFLRRMAVRACNEPIGIDAMEKLTIRDFNAIRSSARSFLL